MTTMLMTIDDDDDDVYNDVDDGDNDAINDSSTYTFSPGCVVSSYRPVKLPDSNNNNNCRSTSYYSTSNITLKSIVKVIT